MTDLTDKRVLLIITGGIAAYKSPDLVRKLKDLGCDVRVAMTAAAVTFVTPLTFQAVSGNPVHTELLDPAAEAGMGHIELARWPDWIRVAPASADFLARLAHGLANDLATTLCLASDRPTAVAPAMNRLMWSNPATQDNIRLLKQRGMQIWGPDQGSQACGETGPGRMVEPIELCRAVVDLLTPSSTPLAGKTLLITAGPTREPLDPVRYISNRSSGKMGFSIAKAAATLGAKVTLVCGPVNLPTPSAVNRIDVETAQQMHQAVMAAIQSADIFIATAAVADYRAGKPAGHKIKKSHDALTLSLTRNPDILADVAALPDPPFTVGFAAETQHVREYAENKRRRKKLNMIAANQVGSGKGFDTTNNALLVLWEKGEKDLPLMNKDDLANALMSLIVERYNVNSHDIHKQRRTD